MGYQPTVNVDHQWNSKLDTYKPPIRIPVDTGIGTDIETFSTGSNSFQTNYKPTSTVSFKHYNKTITTDATGTKVRGSEVRKKWVDGRLVEDIEQPFDSEHPNKWPGGQTSVDTIQLYPSNTDQPNDEWKREERESFFWFLATPNPTLETLETWQQQQEERLLAVAQRYQISLQNLTEWHRNELDRYLALRDQYAHIDTENSGWKGMERTRLDWLIHQNSATAEDLQQWQNENRDKLMQMARQYHITLEELTRWQLEELNRIYKHFREQNFKMIPSPLTDDFHIKEQERINDLIREHNATIYQLQNSIQVDQQKLADLSKKYSGNVQDMELWLKSEVARLRNLITEQRNQMSHITLWQKSERERLENILNQHRGSVEEVIAQTERDRNYIQTLAAKYNVSIEELEKWQREELERLQKEGQRKLDKDIEEWQWQEHDRLKAIINQNDLTIDEFRRQVMNDRAHLESLAQSYKTSTTEVENWLQQKIDEFQSQGLLKDVKEELAQWQREERERLMAIVRQNDLTVSEIEEKIAKDQAYMFALAQTYQLKVEEVEDWLKQEVLRLQTEGLIKSDDLNAWQKREQAEIAKLVEENKLTIEELEGKLLTDRQRLQKTADMYKIEVSEIEEWMKKEATRLMNLSFLRMQENLSGWQKTERDRLLELVKQNQLTMADLEEKMKADRAHFESVARQNQVRVEDIEAWIKNEITKLQQEGLLEMEKLRTWQTEWRDNLMKLVMERDFTVDEFHKWLLNDRERLLDLANKNHMKVEEIEQFMMSEESRLIDMGLLKPHERLTDWQTAQRRYAEQLAQQHYQSTEQLEQRLRQDRELLQRIAKTYSVQVEEIEKNMKKELDRLIDDGKLQISNLTAWQLAEREHLERLIKENKQWSVDEIEAVLRKDREHMQSLAFKYHISVAEVEKWLQGEVDRLRRQGQENLDKRTAWQEAEHQRILRLLRMQSDISADEFERKVKADRNFLQQLANEYHVSIVEVEQYLKKVIEELNKKGRFAVERLQAWQLAEREYIKQLIAQYKDSLSTTEYERKLLNDRAHLRQLADQYRVHVEEIEKWMIEELRRLRHGSEKKLQELAAWQLAEVQRIKDLIRKNQRMSYVEFEAQLMQDRNRIQKMATQHAWSVEQLEKWLRQVLIDIKTSGEVQLKDLAKWQEGEQKRLIELLLKESNTISLENLEFQLRNDHAHIQKLMQEYSLDRDEILLWLSNELKRLKESGLFQVEQLTYWQRIERDRLLEWLKQKHNAVTVEQFNEFLRRDKERLQRIAQDYNTTAEEVEIWMRKEAARLRVLNQICGSVEVISPSPFQTTEELWKMQTREELQATARATRMTWPDFERYLKDQRMRWEQFSRQYGVTVPEIETWLRQVAEELLRTGLMQGSVSLEEWKTKEKLYIQSMIDEKLRKQQQWSIEELERQLLNNYEHQQQLAQAFYVSVEQIKAFYKQELQRLLNERLIISEHLVDWQRREKERLYRIVKGQPVMSQQQLEDHVLTDSSLLQRLSAEYRVTREELVYFIRGEIRRLVDLGLVRGSLAKYSNWNQQESERLRNIAAEIDITEEEFLDFIAGDHSYQNQLAQTYVVPLDKLAPFQRIEIGVMKREGRLENRQLLPSAPWQKRERDRLYSFAKNPNFSWNALKEWQLRNDYMQQLAEGYGVSVQHLKEWQVAEYQRLQNLADLVGMTLPELQDFREKENHYITYVMHKKSSSEASRISWGSSESERMAELERRCGLSGERLLVWRRTLYLLCQGLIPMDNAAKLGHVPLTQQVTDGRGDQQIIQTDETIIDEPGVAGSEDKSWLQRSKDPEFYELSPVSSIPRRNSNLPSHGLYYGQQHKVETSSNIEVQSKVDVESPKLWDKFKQKTTDLFG